MPRIILAGGGSAGHVEPALSVADALVRIDSTVIPEFLGTSSGLETHLVPARGYQLRTIPKVPMPRRLDLSAFSFPIRILAAILKARREIKGASAMIGFGGYVSAAAYLAALTLGIPYTIHEANSKPGWANRMGRFFASHLAVNFPSVGKKWKKSKVTGMPIRDSIAALAQASRSDIQEIRDDLLIRSGFDPKLPVVVIFGGSLGSRKINEAVAEALDRGVFAGVQVIHALGMNNQLPAARSGYLPLPYLENMPAVLAAADLIICRSGAVTCSELMTVGRFAILVPLAHGNGEQVDNAKELVARGLAVMIQDSNFNAAWLCDNFAENLARASGIGDRRSIDSVESAAQIAKLVLSDLPKFGAQR